MDSKQRNSAYAIVNNGRALSYGHPPKPALDLNNHPPPPFDTKFDYSVPIMGVPQPSAAPKQAVVCGSVP